jgi:ribosomal protein S18 acetylase RimI-like enzyme
MDIVATRPDHLEILARWFPDEQSVRQWGGPRFRHPFTELTFREDMRWGKMPAYSLLDGENGMIGFGQYYEKAGRCHLARLVIDPERRGSGAGRFFVRGLMQIGMSDLGCDECSLFVMNWNRLAIRCYTAVGFVKAPYPEREPVLEDIDFMLYRRAPQA